MIENLISMHNLW